MRRLGLGLGLGLGVLVACGGGEEPPPVGPIAATVQHYEYAFDVISRAAHARVIAIVDTAGDCFRIPFRAEGFDASTARIDDTPVASAKVEADALTVCGPGHRAGETLTLDVDVVIPMKTLSTSQVGYSITRDRDGNPFYYLVSWVGGCDRFGPCDNRPDQFATYTFHVTHPPELMVACPGTITQVSSTETRCEFDHAGGPTYSTFGVGAYPAWTPYDMGTWGSARATVYDRAGNGLAEVIDPAHHDGFVRWLEERFGPYPYGDELRVFTAPTYWNGFEHPGNIVLDDSLHRVLRPSYLRNTQHILDHEIAHQWAGDQTTLADTYDFVWKEAMAEYLTYAYESQTDPVAARATLSAWKSFSRGAAYFPVPLEKPALFEYYGDVYGPGPMVLFRQLEVLSSQDKVLAGLATLLGAERAISVDDVIAALESSTGIDLEDYASAWIRGTGAPVWPTVSVTYEPGPETSTVSVRITNGAERRCKFHVGLRGEAPEDAVDVAVDTLRDGTEQTITIPTPAFDVTTTVVDPHAECLVYPGIATRTERRHPWRSDRGLAHDRAAP